MTKQIESTGPKSTTDLGGQKHSVVMRCIKSLFDFNASDKKFFKYLFGFFAVGLIWAILDVITGNTTDLTDVLICSFFVMWNISQSANE